MLQSCQTRTLSRLLLIMIQFPFLREINDIKIISTITVRLDKVKSYDATFGLTEIWLHVVTLIAEAVEIIWCYTNFFFRENFGEN